MRQHAWLSPDPALDIYFVAFTAEKSAWWGPAASSKSCQPDLRKIASAPCSTSTWWDDSLQRRARRCRVVVQGSDSAAEWAELVAPRCQNLGLFCRLGGDGYGPSDMTPFYGSGIPSCSSSPAPTATTIAPATPPTKSTPWALHRLPIWPPTSAAIRRIA